MYLLFDILFIALCMREFYNHPFLITNRVENCYDSFGQLGEGSRIFEIHRNVAKNSVFFLLVMRLQSIISVT